MKNALAQNTILSRCVPEPNTGCWLWLNRIGDQGYGHIDIDGRENIGAHVVSWLVFRGGPVPDKLFVCHVCDLRCCVNPNHLFLGTCNDNNQDMVTKGRHARGESHGSARLVADDIATIKSMRAAGYSTLEIGTKFGVGRGTIARIISGRRWKHMLGETP